LHGLDASVKDWRGSSQRPRAGHSAAEEGRQRSHPPACRVSRLDLRPVRVWPGPFCPVLDAATVPCPQCHGRDPQARAYGQGRTTRLLGKGVWPAWPSGRQAQRRTGSAHKAPFYATVTDWRRWLVPVTGRIWHGPGVRGRPPWLVGMGSLWAGCVVGLPVAQPGLTVWCLPSMVLCGLGRRAGRHRPVLHSMRRRPASLPGPGFPDLASHPPAIPVPMILARPALGPVLAVTPAVGDGPPPGRGAT
jgi:hypothetical protein